MKNLKYAIIGCRDLTGKIIQENILLRNLTRQFHAPFADYYSVMVNENGLPHRNLSTMVVISQRKASAL